MRIGRLHTRRVLRKFSKNLHNADNYVANEKQEERISGGKITNDFSNMFQVQIVSNGDQFCSGAIISQDYILTAAHCVENTKPDDVFVRAKTRRLNEGGFIIEIDEIVIHPEYDYPQNNNDIAYMKTAEPIRFDLLFVPARFDTPDTEFPDVITVFGYGRQENGEAFSEELRSVNLTVIHNMRCQVIYPEVGITKNMFCAENTRDGGQGACKGDGGGPATRKNRRGLDVLVGISSFTRGCGASMGPSVFTNLRAREIREFISNGTGVDPRIYA
ncbi:vitellin-degrading protease-like isoform X2 [Bicyclus anynana]|uniref:Vitellin-degrading protease-like isoform X2 n=1 Tax=Bicyclus anynana TaxID=110368 RepID=A0ABM3LFP8_BICAN|nr:vitellin-degrading protease-like isoform X2 [Bicyclus anynana]